MIRHREPAHLGMAQDNVAACLVVHQEPSFSKARIASLPELTGQAAHAGISTISSVIGGGTGSPFETGQITSDGVLDIGQRFGTTLALRNAAGKRGALGHEYSVLIRLNHHSIFHAFNLRGPPWKVNRRNHAASLLSPERSEQEQTEKTEGFSLFPPFPPVKTTRFPALQQIGVARL